MLPDSGQDGVEVARALLGFDLDDDGRVRVCVLPDGEGGVAWGVADTREPAAGGRGAGAVR